MDQLQAVHEELDRKFRTLCARVEAQHDRVDNVCQGYGVLRRSLDPSSPADFGRSHAARVRLIFGCPTFA